MRKVAGVSWVLGAVPVAWAHAVLLQSVPPTGSAVTGPAIPISLRFNSRIDARRSRIAWLANGKEISLALAPQLAPDTVTAEIKGAKPGPCLVRWQVLASDGHISRGEFVLQVK